MAAELGVPVTARGAGTGLSGACIPEPDGILVSFERMAALLEIDEANQVAVVQPGLTLAELDEATAAVGLVYPVFPGTLAASLGGNVATNAGGMRAVKYGVTRNQVLGLEAVLGTGEVIRTGGRFVKNTSGYDLTQLDHRLGGHARPRHRGHPEAAPPPHPHRVDPGPVRHRRRGRRGRAPHRRLRRAADDPRVHRPGHHEGPAAGQRPHPRRARRRHRAHRGLPDRGARGPRRAAPRHRRGHRGRAARRRRRPRRLRAAARARAPSCWPPGRTPSGW